MAIDPGGVPLRVRSFVARLRPEYQQVVVAARDRLRPGTADRFEVAVSSWLDGLTGDLGADVLLAGVETVPRSWPSNVRRLDPYGRGEAVGFVGPFEIEVIGRQAFDSVVLVIGPDAADLVGAAADEPRGALDQRVERCLDAAVEAVRPGGLVAVAAFGGFTDRLHRPDATVRPLVDDHGAIGEVALIAVDTIVAGA